MGDQLLPFPWLDVVLILALVALNGVFAMSELAIVSSREARLKALAKAGNGGARRALDLAAEPGRFLSTVQIGITLIGILAGAYSGASLGQPVAQRLMLLGIDPETAQTLGFGLVIVATTFVSLIIGELVRRNNLSATAEQVRALIEEQSLAYEQPAEVVKWFYSQPERLAEFEGLAVEDNVIDWVLKQAKVVDQPADFEKLMGNAA